MIRCPDGKVILIDCGSKRNFDTTLRARAAMALRHLCNNEPLLAVILTHSDSDHYNQVNNVLGDDKFVETMDFELDDKVYELPWDPNRVAVENVYFSDMKYGTLLRSGAKKSFDDYVASLDKGPLKQYTQSGTNDFVYKSGAKINLVNLDGVNPHIRGWAWNNAGTNTGGNRNANFAFKGKPAERVHHGENWAVSILVGNVARSSADQSDGDGCNAGSLVTLLEFDGKKCLICGDATISTEALLLADFPAEISGLEIVQVPHHGSAVTSSSDSFIAKTRAKEVVMSVAKIETSHHLPGLGVVTKYLKGAEEMEESTTVDGWKLCANYAPGIVTEATKMADEFKEKYKVKDDNGLYVLPTEVIETLLKKSRGEPVCVAVTPKNGFMLFRQETVREVYQTGPQEVDVELQLGPNESFN